jgi:hypothetical protein
MTGIHKSRQPCHQEGDEIYVEPGQSRVKKLSVICVDGRVQSREITLQSQLDVSAEGSLLP